MTLAPNAERTHCYTYPRGALTVDCVVLARTASRLQLLLIRRGEPPFLGAWALPGGFVHVDETTDTAAARELEEETGLTCAGLIQFQAFSEVERDPRERVVSIAHYAVLDGNAPAVQAASDADDAAWFALEELPPLAFDHNKIIDVALRRVKSRAGNWLTSEQPRRVPRLG